MIKPGPLALTHLLYLHGFRSSPHSTKARQVADWVLRHRGDLVWWCPQLPPSPGLAMQLLLDGTRDWPAARMGVIGSSLGGFYAAALVQRLGCRAVLLNPAVHPARDLARHIGETTSWHGDEPFHFRPEYVDELHALAGGEPLHPERICAVIAKGDEVLDWREMAARHAASRILLLEGGDHALSNFTELLPQVLAELGLDDTLTSR